MSTNSLLPPGFERLARTPGRERVQSGSPAALLLEWAGDIRDIRKIPAIEALAHRWMPKLRAMRAVETLVGDRKAYVYVPKVESLEALTQELAKAGVRASALPDADLNVGAIRAKLGFTQEQFALRYGLDVDAVRNWETGRRSPDTAARSYLRAISGNPAAVEDALWSGQAPEEGGPQHNGRPGDGSHRDDAAEPDSRRVAAERLADFRRRKHNPDSPSTADLLAESRAGRLHTLTAERQ